MLTASGDYAQLVQCKIIALDTKERPLAVRVIKKLNFMSETIDFDESVSLKARRC